MSSHQPEPQKTLVSWKEIASYLGRAERTVKRWERERGLPVHRVPGGERGGVYAYATELEGWLNSAREPGTTGLNGDVEEEIAVSTESAGGSHSEADPLPVETEGRNGGRVNGLRARLALMGMSAALAGVGIVAILAHPIGNWIRHRGSAIAGNERASAIPQNGAEVSDAEKSAAHDLCLKGRFEWNQRDPDSLNRALDDFTQAIVHNPYDAHAYVGLADSYEMLFIYGSRGDDDARDRAMAAARKAVELDGSLSEAHRAMGYAMWRAHEFDEAEKELKLAIRLDPKDPLAHLWLSHTLAGQGKDDECLAEIDKAQELDPGSATILAMKGERLFLLGKKEEGIALLSAAARAEPKLSLAHLYLADVEYSERNYPAYLKESQAVADSRGDGWLKQVTAKLSSAYARDGERGLLNAEFAVQESCTPPLYLWQAPTRMERAIYCLKRDRKPEALQLLEEAGANGEKDFEDFRAEYASGPGRDGKGDFSKLADDPRFQALMKQKTDVQKTAKLGASSASGNL